MHIIQYIIKKNIPIHFLQFWTYYLPSKSCGLRYFEPTTRSFSLGIMSGKRNEDYSLWSRQVNSVWVAKMTRTHTCQQCSKQCKADPQCKSVIFNKAFEECSFNYGNIGPLTAILLPSQFSFFGIASAYKTCWKMLNINQTQLVYHLLNSDL